MKVETLERNYPNSVAQIRADERAKVIDEFGERIKDFVETHGTVPNHFNIELIKEQLKGAIIKQYHENGTLWQYMIEGDYRCDCGCNVFHKEYNKARNKIWYICNACNCVVGEVKDECLQEYLNVGVWK